MDVVDNDGVGGVSDGDSRGSAFRNGQRGRDALAKPLFADEGEDTSCGTAGALGSEALMRVGDLWAASSQVVFVSVRLLNEDDVVLQRELREELVLDRGLVRIKLEKSCCIPRHKFAAQ